MSYANPTTKRAQVLEGLRAAIAGISTAGGFATNVISAEVYNAHQLVMGKQLPAAAVVVLQDQRTAGLICAQDEYEMNVEVLCALRVSPNESAWKEKIHSFAGDVQQALNNDRQLGGSAVYIEVDGVDVQDVENNGAAFAVAAVACTVVYRVSVADVTV